MVSIDYYTGDCIVAGYSYINVNGAKKMEKKILVAYFSASGKTRTLAQKLAEKANADLHEIVPAELYTKADLDWMNKNSRSSVEMNNKTIRPGILKSELNTGDYDTILLGFPIWWYVAPTVINTFLESYDFSGKKIVLFATSGGSGFGNTVKELQPSAPDAKIVEGKVLNHVADKNIESFIADIY